MYRILSFIHGCVVKYTGIIEYFKDIADGQGTIEFFNPLSYQVIETVQWGKKKFMRTLSNISNDLLLIGIVYMTIVQLIMLMILILKNLPTRTNTRI